MPVIRTHGKPLRERCNVQLRVKTTIPHNVHDDYDLSPLSPAPQRGRSTTRKPTRTSKRTSHQGSSHSNLNSTNERVPRLHPIHTPTAQGLSSLHQLVPYIYVGFHEGRYLPQSMVSANGSLFTHIVKITYASGSWKAGECDLQVDAKRGLLILGLIVPAPQADADASEGEKDSERTKTILTENQLLAARDFLALALPYYAEAHPRMVVKGYNSRYSDSVRVLITAPEEKGAPVDVMSVAACYLAWASEEPAGTVVEYIKIEEKVPVIWRDAVRGKEAVGLIGRVARWD